MTRACAGLQEGLVSVPTDFFQSSLALGSLMQVRQAGSSNLEPVVNPHVYTATVNMCTAL